MKPNTRYPQPTFWKPGDEFKPIEPVTQLLKFAGLTKDARGYVTFVGSGSISFYVERGTFGMGYIEAQCPMAMFGLNFEHTGPNNLAYVQSEHFKRSFP